MTTAPTELEVVQGQTKVFGATWTTNGQARPITGAGHDYVGHLQVRRRRGSYTTAPIIDVSSIDGSSPANILLEPNGTVGAVRVRIPGALTALLKRTVQYDLWLINRDDPTERVRLMFGQMTVSASATDNSALVTVIVTDTEDLSA